MRQLRSIEKIPLLCFLRFKNQLPSPVLSDPDNSLISIYEYVKVMPEVKYLSKVAVIMGSQSDYEVMKDACEVLRSFQVDSKNRTYLQLKLQDLIGFRNKH